MANRRGGLDENLLGRTEPSGSRTVQDALRAASSGSRAAMVVAFIAILVAVPWLATITGIFLSRADGEAAERRRVDDLLTQQNGFQDIQLQLIQESLANKECAFLEAEYVIAGGGTAGCIMAEKLAKAGHTVILLESGVVQDEDVLLDDPKNSGVLVNQHTNRFFLMAGHDKQLPSPSHRRLPLVHGNVMGGGSAVNGMQHVQGTPYIYNQWQTLAGGDPDWGTANVRTVFKNLETFAGQAGQFNAAEHGTTGRLDVRQSSINTNVADAYVTAATGLGHVLSPDYNDFSTPRGVFRRWQVAQQPDKTRESSFTAHLKDYITEFSPGYYVSSDSRLKVYTGAHVLTVRWATNTATPKAIGLHTLINGKDTMVRAWRKTIISTGSLISPAILQYSGVGDAAKLTPLGVPVKYNNPNVGQHVLNHPIWVLIATGTTPAPTGDNEALYAAGLMAATAGNPDPTARDFQMIMGGSNNVWSIAALLLDAKSEGTVDIQYANPVRPALYVNKYLSDPADLAAMVEGYEIMYNVLAAIPGTTFPPGTPAPGNTAGIQAYLLERYTQAYHWVGANRMSATSATGVVNNNCHVHGVDDLVVADNSIVPVNAQGNAAATAYLVGSICAAKVLSLV